MTLIGLYFLNGAILDSKIDNLEVFRCGLTNKSMPEITTWTNHLQEINITDNASLFDPYSREENEQFLKELSPSCRVKVDDYKVNSRL